jgi:uncharacterized GH25 family protein
MDRALILAGLLVLAARAEAHDTWLLPESFELPVSGVAVLHLTSGLGFPDLDTAIAPERVTRAAWRVAKQTGDIPTRSTAEHSLRLSTALPAPGLATIWVDLAPATIDRGPAEVEQYLEEIGARDTVRQRWLASPSRRWRELNAKHAKAFVRVGGQSDRSWSEPVGMFLEIVPESDPTTVAVGDELTVRVLREGGSISGFSLELVGERDATTQRERTDAGGLATFRIDAPGRWLLRGTYLRAAPGGPDVDWESHGTTLTFEVLPLN